MLKTLSFEFFLFEFSYFYLAEYQKKKKRFGLLKTATAIIRFGKLLSSKHENTNSNLITLTLN